MDLNERLKEIELSKKRKKKGEQLVRSGVQTLIVGFILVFFDFLMIFAKASLVVDIIIGATAMIFLSVSLICFVKGLPMWRKDPPLVAEAKKAIKEDIEKERKEKKLSKEKQYQN